MSEPVRSEFRMYAPLQRFLDRHCDQTWQCVKVIFDGGTHNEIDILGLWRSMRGIKLYSIEVKESDVQTVVHQAVTRQLYCDYSYIALPLRRRAGKLGYLLYKLAENFTFLKEKGIGILLYDEETKRVIEVMYSRRSKVIQQAWRSTLLNAINEMEIDGKG